MKVVVQRSLKSTVSVNNKVIGSIKKGIVALVAFTHNDTEKDIDYIINKLINLRIFDDEEGIMNKSLIDIQGSVLSISQFTLYADTKKGRRPSYAKALEHKQASAMYDWFNNKLKEYVNVETGQFGSDMQVNIINDGPVTIIIESDEKYEKN